MAEFGFRCYVDENGVDVIRAWYDGVEEKVQNKFYSRLSLLGSLRRNDWKGEPYKQLHGAYSEIGEVRFKALKTVYRPLGFHHGKNFVLLFPAIEKGDRFEPKSAPDTALKRRLEVIEKKERSCGLDWLPFQ